MCCAYLDCSDAELGQAAASLLESDRVIFIIGRGGGGHMAAARAVAACFEKSGVDIEIMDAGFVIESIMTGTKPRTTRRATSSWAG